jgi:hypothetical protein
VQVQLLYFPGCPHVDRARRQLRQALGALEQRPEVTKIDVTDASTPEHLRRWGSPTILVDGVDVAGGVPSGSSCRLYAGSPDPGVPPLALIQAALARAREGGR